MRKQRLLRKISSKLPVFRIFCGSFKPFFALNFILHTTINQLPHLILTNFTRQDHHHNYNLRHNHNRNHIGNHISSHYNRNIPTLYYRKIFFVITIVVQVNYIFKCNTRKKRSSYKSLV